MTSEIDVDLESNWLRSIRSAGTAHGGFFCIERNRNGFNPTCCSRIHWCFQRLVIPRLSLRSLRANAPENRSKLELFLESCSKFCGCFNSRNRENRTMRHEKVGKHQGTRTRGVRYQSLMRMFMSSHLQQCRKPAIETFSARNLRSPARKCRENDDILMESQVWLRLNRVEGIKLLRFR